MQKEIEVMRAEMNMKVNEMIAAINKLKFEHQTRTFVRNRPAVNQQGKTDEARGPETKASKDATEEKKIYQDANTQRANKQREINNEGDEGQDEASARTGQSKEKEDEMEQLTETRVVEQPSNHDEGRWRNKKVLRK
jgi:hypothetical protein